MSFAFILADIILIALVIYALTGGADYGGGVWDLFAGGPRMRRQREVIEEAIAPIWEANHVWLILVIVLLFSVFPPGFAAIMTALHIPLSIVLVGIVLRGSAFVFRKYDSQDDEVHRRWSTLFGIASFLTPFFLGMTLGAIASGEIRVSQGAVTTGFFAGWLRPFAIACGLFAQALFAFLAAVYMTVETKDEYEVQEDFRVRALLAGVLLAPAAVFVFFVARHGAPIIFHGLTSWWAPLLLVATSACAIATLVALWQRRYALARLTAGGQVALILIGWGVAQYPYLLVPDITFQEAATADSTMELILIVLALGAILLLPSFAYLFYVFKGREPRQRTRTEREPLH